MLKHLVRPSLLAMSVVLLPAIVMAEEIDDARRHELINLLKQDCGSCHGMTLQGGLGPALTPAVLNQKPREVMVATILAGRPGTPMPPWRNLLSEQETRWLVDMLYRGIE